MEITFKLPQDAAANLVNLLGQLPTNSGVFPILVQLVDQYKAQTETKEEAQNG